MPDFRMRLRSQGWDFTLQDETSDLKMRLHIKGETLDLRMRDFILKDETSNLRMRDFIL